ncbi:MAG: hypothetical protein CMF69_03170 [Magnetovibrio sp.]|nr:hypothetical protein [Magnetovibrio sp.]|tara:strand:- start:2520 stop:3407 length:888 start_codon:yes stop_codon:yes gene_type:complete
MEKINKYYGLCINSERRKNLEKYEKRFDISIDTSFSENAFEKNFNYYKKRNLIVKDWRGTLGGVGCTLSFGNIYEDIVKNKYEYSIIFEDDIDWNEEFYGPCQKRSFKFVLNTIDFNDNWDIFYLGTESRGELSKQRHIKENIYELEHGKIIIPIKEKTFKSFDISRKSNKVKKHDNFGGQQAFILTYKGALQLLKYYYPAYEISDGLNEYAIMNHDIINRAFIPTLFTQLSSPGLPQFDGKLWAGQTRGNFYHSNEKYDKNMTIYKKGCSGKPLSKKYKWDKTHCELFKTKMAK